VAPIELNLASSSGVIAVVTAMDEGISPAAPGGVELKIDFSAEVTPDCAPADFDTCASPVAGTISAAFCSTRFLLDASDCRSVRPASDFEDNARAAEWLEGSRDALGARAGLSLAAISAGSLQLSQTVKETSSKAIATNAGIQ